MSHQCSNLAGGDLVSRPGQLTNIGTNLLHKGRQMKMRDVRGSWPLRLIETKKWLFLGTEFAMPTGFGKINPLHVGTDKKCKTGWRGPIFME